MIQKPYDNGDEYDSMGFVDNGKETEAKATNELDKLNEELETYGDSPMTKKIFG